MDGIETALQQGFSPVKVNAVLLDEWNEQELPSFWRWIRHKPIAVQFIELMLTAENRSLFQKRHLRAESIKKSS